MRARNRPRIGVAAACWLAASALCAFGLPGGSPAPLAAQQRDARLPEPGDLWLEIAPTLFNWSEQFAEDGSREPLFADFDGPIAGRLFPGPQTFIDELNADAAALGFDPVTESEFSLGRLDFQNVNAQIRRLALGFELGVFRRLAVGFRAPLVLTDLEPAFVFDSASATVTNAIAAIPPGSTFLAEASDAITQLDLLIANGGLMGQELADAMQLRADADAFLTALQLRVGGERLVPTASSDAGLQMLARFDGFVAEFDALGLTLPALMLPQLASAADLPRYFENSPVAGEIPGATSSGLTIGEIEISARIGILDQITPRRRDPRDAEPARPTAADSGAVRPPPLQRDRPSIRFRTSVGALLRLPQATNGAPPLEDPSNFLDLPIADGQTDIEISLYQDVGFGDWFLLRAVGRYGIQRPDVLPLRIAPPDRPFAFESTLATVNRDLGDYRQVTLRPSVRLNSAIWIGLEYDYWTLGDASFSVVPPPPADPGEGEPAPPPQLPDASPLEIQSGQTRHMLGIGLAYDLSEARSREHAIADRSPVRNPWRFEISLRRSISGSGGRTPAPFRYAASFRVPIGIF